MPHQRPTNGTVDDLMASHVVRRLEQRIQYVLNMASTDTKTMMKDIIYDVYFEKEEMRNRMMELEEVNTNLKLLLDAHGIDYSRVDYFAPRASRRQPPPASGAPSAAPPASGAPSSAAPASGAPSSAAPASGAPSSAAPTSAASSSAASSSAASSSAAPASAAPSSAAPSSAAPASAAQASQDVGSQVTLAPTAPASREVGAPGVSAEPTSQEVEVPVEEAHGAPVPQAAEAMEIDPPVVQMVEDLVAQVAGEPTSQEEELEASGKESDL